MAVMALALSSCQQNESKTNNASASVLPAGSELVETVHTPASPDAAVLSFEKSSHDFGKIKAGEKVHYDFNFTNTGKTPLIISSATATCGCTVPETPKEPIKPGESSVIKVIFDSTGKSGLQDKVITVASNGNPPSVEVHLTGEVTN